MKCLELQVIFCKRATNYRALLRKMTYKDKASYASSPPFNKKIELLSTKLQHTATHCRTLQHNTTHCNLLDKTHHKNKCFSTHKIGPINAATHYVTLQHNTLHCNTLPHVRMDCNVLGKYKRFSPHKTGFMGQTLQHTATLQHNASHCNTLQVLQKKRTRASGHKRPALCNKRCNTRCNTRQRTVTHGNTRQHVATQCNTLQHTTAHCNVLEKNKCFGPQKTGFMEQTQRGW